VSIFCDRVLAGKPIEVFGDGTQTRDLLYVEDCAEFLLRTASAENARGEIVNAGTGTDVTINDLAQRIGKGRVDVQNVAHPHPQAEIARLVCDAGKARSLVDWQPRVDLNEGIERTFAWLASR
jgi:nucleoside-diphosphate-sugar epimerase